MIEIDAGSLKAIREELDEMLYALVDLRIALEVPFAATGFPKFEALQRVVARLSHQHRTLFRLLRLAEPVEDEAFRSALPERLRRALEQVGVVRKEDTGAWRTAGLIVVPVEGLFVMVGVPPSYPTLTMPCRPWFDMSSFVVARALPVSLENLTVLDVCSGSGIQSMLAARRGACRVVALELDEVAVGVARANSVLNGLGDRIDVRRSDMLDGLRADERFDFVVCNTPHAPLVEGLRPPQSSSSIGNAVLWRLLEGLPARLTEQGKGVVASWRAAGHESSTYQLRSIAGRLAAAGLSASAYVDRAPDTVDSVLRMLEADVRQRSTVDSEVKEIVDAARLTLGLPDAPVDGFYNQLIWFERGRALDADREPRIFGLAPPAVT